MRDQNRRLGFATLIFILGAALLVSPTAQAQKSLKPGSTCELQEKITVRNKAQRKNVKTRQLDKGSTFKIIRYHRVWVRIQTSDGIAFATPKSIRNHCRAPQAALKTPVPPQKPAPQASNPQPITQTEEQSAPQTQSESQETAPKAPEQKAAPDPEPAAAPTPQLAPKLPLQTTQVPDLSVRNRHRSTHISPAAWVALGVGAASMGASAYFVSQLTTQDEARTGQAALLTGTTGIIGVIIGFSYILTPEERVSVPSEASDNQISTAISVGPGSIAISGRF